VFLAAARADIQLSKATDETLPSEVSSWLKEVMTKSQGHIKPNIVEVEDESVLKVFPGGRFYGVYFPRWPRVIPPPAELLSENLLCIRQGRNLELIRGDNGLKVFLARNLQGVENEDAACLAARASLVLASFNATGGPYPLQKPDVSAVRQGNTILSIARAAVQEPNRGNIEISIEFGPGGRADSGGIKLAGRPRRGPPS
jgi:hypothetical protein